MLNSQIKCSLLAISLLLALITQAVSTKSNLKNSEQQKKKNSASKAKEDKVLNLSPYDYPKNEKGKDDQVTIAILGTNDVHGQAFEKELTFGKDTLKIGGFKLLSSVINKMRQEFSKHFLWLDAGDQFTGTVEKERTDGKLMIDFYNLMRVDSVAIGNHEWDKKEDKLREWMTAELGAYFNGVNQQWSQQHYGKDNKNLYLAANLKLKEGKQNDLPNRMPTKIFSFEKGKIKIGVIGLTTIETVAKTAGFNKEKFEITDYKQVVESASADLRKNGCQAVLIVSHVGTNCKKPTISQEDLKDLYELKLRDKKYQAGDKCDGEMADLLKVLDPKAVDGVVAGHIHEAVHHFFNDIPVIQNPMSNVFTNLLYLRFTKNKKGEFTLSPKDTRIEGPIPLCNKVYSNNKRCNEYQQLTNGITLQDFTFHGSQLVVDKNIEELFEKKYSELNQQIAQFKKEVVFTTEYRLERDVKKENVLGNLVADIIRNETKADIAFDTPGSLRYVWDIGVVSKYELNNMFPFGGEFGQMKFKGEEIIEIIKKLQIEGKMGYIYAFSGIKMKLIKHKDGKKTLDESSLVMNDGTPLDKNKEYSVGSSTFLLQGGDDMISFKERNSKKEITNKVNILVAVERQLNNIKLFTKENATNFLGRITIQPAFEWNKVKKLLNKKS